MASQQQIFAVLAEASGPMSRQQLEEKVGESYRKFQSQLDRWVKADPPLVEDMGDHHYVLTDKGREASLEKGEFKDIIGEDQHSEESLGTTEYQQFLKFGRLTGVTPMALIKQTADHVWNGGDFRDLVWVATGLQQMGLRQDLRTRWFHSWRSYLKQGMPEGVPAEFFSNKVEGAKSEEERRIEKGQGKRDYVLSVDDVPTYVGDGNGDLDYKDALDLAKIRAARKAGPNGASATPSSLADEVSKIFAAFQAMGGQQTAGKNYVVRAGEGGSAVVEEVEPGRPVVLPAPAQPPAHKMYVINQGRVEELDPSKPMFLPSPAAPPAPPAGGWMVDKQTGQMTPIKPGEPIIIQVQQPSQVSQQTPIQVKDRDGNPMVLDLATYVKLEEHRDNQRRSEESHKTKMEIASSFKDLLSKAGAAVGHVLEGKEA